MLSSSIENGLVGKYGGIVALQLRSHPETIPAVMERLDHYLDALTSRDFFRGKLFLVEVHRIPYQVLSHRLSVRPRTYWENLVRMDPGWQKSNTQY